VPTSLPPPVLHMFYRSEVLSRWASNEEIVDAMHASMHIPFYMSYIKPAGGSWGVDGGLSANVFDINGDPKTLKVTSTCMRGAVHPLRSLTLWDCFAPPKAQRRAEIYGQGCAVELPCLPAPLSAAGVGAGAEFEAGDTSLLAVTNTSTSGGNEGKGKEKGNEDEGVVTETETAARNRSTAQQHQDSLPTLAKRVLLASFVWLLRALEEPRVQVAVGLGACAYTLPRLLKKWKAAK